MVEKSQNIFSPINPLYMSTTTLSKASLLHKIGRNYVLQGLGEKNFDAIPYDEAVELRAPLTAGGSEVPLKGKETLRTQWWAPLPHLIEKVEVLDTFVNKAETAVTVEFRCYIKQPSCVLRVMDRFTVNEAGKIISQENFFDPRAVTHPAQ
jgi:hypothetical protein